MKQALLAALAVSFSLVPALGSGMRQDRDQVGVADQPQAVNLKGQLALPAFPSNGLCLDIASARQVVDDRSDRLHIAWKMTYDGPRHPLIIIEPTLDRPFRGKTTLSVYATGKSGRSYEMAFTSDPVMALAPAFPLPKKDWFVTIPQGEKGEGTFELVTADVRRYFTGKLPDEFEVARSPQLHVRLLHEVRERGESLKLDAWTGSLISATIPLPLKDW